MRFINTHARWLIATACFGLVWGVMSGTALAAGSGIVTLTFDDGSVSQYETSLSLLKASGQKAVFFLNSALLGTNSFMTWGQVAQLQRDGFEIGAHTAHHVELPVVGQRTLNAEVNQDYAAFVAHGIVPTDFASPYGAYDNTTLATITKTYNSHRAFANQGLNVWPYNKYLLSVHYVTSQTTLAQAKAWVDEAVTADAWLVMVFHEVLPTVAPNNDYAWHMTKFKGLIDYLSAKQVKTRTIMDVLTQNTNLTTNAGFVNGLTGWSTDSPRFLTVDAANNGNYPNPRNAVRMIGNPRAVHLFGQKIPVAVGALYGLRAYTDSRALDSGEVGFYIDEYDQKDAWISGKYLGSFGNKNVIDHSYRYTPTSAAVKKSAVQVYMIAGTMGSVFLDNIEFFPH